MKGLKMFKGDFVIKNNDFESIKNEELLVQEIENLLWSDPNSVVWDENRGLDRRIIFSKNKKLIKNEINNKILKYFPNRVLTVENIIVYFEGTKTKAKAKINTIYGNIEVTI